MGCNGIYVENLVSLCPCVHARSRGHWMSLYDDRYGIHTFDGLQGFDSFSSAWKDMMDGDSEIIQYDYVTYICQLNNNPKVPRSFLSPRFNSS
jgi:hypothetical protein